MAPKYHMTYFQVRGLGEPIRLLMTYGNIDFEDTRITKDVWPQLKPQTPIGSLPTIVMDGKTYYQSLALTRYFGRRVGLGGKNELEDLEIDIAVDTMNDFRAKMAAAEYEPDQAVKEAKYKILIAETIPFFLKKLEENAAANKGYMALGRLTWADFYCAGIIDYLSYMARQDILASNPNLKAIKDKVLAIPAVKAWYAKAPATEF